MGLVWLCGGAAFFVVSVLYREAHTTDHQFTLTIALLYFGKCSYAQVLVEWNKLSNTNDKGARRVSAMTRHLLQHTRQSQCIASQPCSDPNGAAPTKARIH
jgi:hypothetical protein